MRSPLTIGVLLIAGTALLPSCETTRVNERPFGMGLTYPQNEGFLSENNTLGIQGDSNSLLNEIRQENTPNLSDNSGFNPNPGQSSGGGTINNLIGQSRVNSTSSTPSGSVSTVPRSVTPDVSSSGISTLKPVVPTTFSETIPVAWPTSDPTVVISPYDRTKKIKILNRQTNQPYPSGTVLRDTNFKTEVKKFRVP